MSLTLCLDHLPKANPDPTLKPDPGPTKVFFVMMQQREELQIRDWGIANTTLEEVSALLSTKLGSAR